MKHFAAMLLFASASFCGTLDASISTEQQSGDVQFSMVKGDSEFTVFAKSRSCEASGVTVRIVYADNLPGARRSESKTATFTDCGVTPARITFQTEGRPVLEFRVDETVTRARHVFRP